MDKNIILHIFSFCSYADINRWRRVSKFFNESLQYPFFIFVARKHRNNTKKYPYKIVHNAHSSFSDFFLGDEDDVFEYIGEYIFKNPNIFKVEIDDKAVYRSREYLRDRAVMHNSFISENDGLTEDDYNSETGVAYYQENLMSEDIDDYELECHEKLLKYLP